jgi:hypothetical protein
MKTLTTRILTALALITAIGALVIGMAAAQEPATSPASALPETITVVGSGSAAGAPDTARVEIGVETVSTDLSTAFSQTNQTIQAVIDAVVAAGVAREDVRTSGLNIFSETLGYNVPPIGLPEPIEGGVVEGTVEPMLPAVARNYRVSNIVNVTIRDIGLVEAVITAAVGAGANNIYGLSFDLADRSALETDARVSAMEDAQNRAQHLAEIAGVSLGNIVAIEEGQTGGFDPFRFDIAQGLGGGGSAVIEPGQITSSVVVQVTYQIVR